MTDLSGPAVSTAPDSAPCNNAAADAGSEREKEKAWEFLSASHYRLRECGDVRVVLNDDRKVARNHRPQFLRNRNYPPSRKIRRIGNLAAIVDNARNSKADAA